MNQPTLRLLCDANPMCFGSSTALLAVLDHVRARRTALIHDVTAEILARDPAVDEVIPVNVKDPDCVRSAVRDHHFDAALVVSNRACLNLYLELGFTVFFVDILFWFGTPAPHNIWKDAERTFVQRFPGVDSRADAMPNRPMVVGPLVRSIQASTEKRTGTFIQIGGARSRWIQPGCNSYYPRYVADWLSEWHGLLRPVALTSGLDAVRSIPAGHPFRAICDVVALPHEETLRRIACAERYITTPGLNGVFEGLYTAVPMLFLPPQNATQVAQLQVYESAGLVAPGLNLPHFDVTFPRDMAGMDEARLTTLVLDALPVLGLPDSVRHIREHLDQQELELPMRASARAAFRQQLGPPGAPAIAHEINKWWRELWM